MIVFWNPCAHAKLHQQKCVQKLCSATLNVSIFGLELLEVLVTDQICRRSPRKDVREQDKSYKGSNQEIDKRLELNLRAKTSIKGNGAKPKKYRVSAWTKAENRHRKSLTITYHKHWHISCTFFLKIFVANQGCGLSPRTSGHHAINLHKLTLLSKNFTICVDLCSKMIRTPQN